MLILKKSIHNFSISLLYFIGVSYNIDLFLNKLLNINSTIERLKNLKSMEWVCAKVIMDVSQVQDVWKVF